MNNRKLIICGSAVFLFIVLFPFWYNLGKAVPPPEVELTGKARAAGECVLPGDYMRSHHVEVLDLWRESVVRGAGRIYTNPDGKRFVMSLSNTCLDCHCNRANFCDRCHNYASVRPTCWNCHQDDPKEDS